MTWNNQNNVFQSFTGTPQGGAGSPLNSEWGVSCSAHRSAGNNWSHFSWPPWGSLLPGVWIRIVGNVVQVCLLIVGDPGASTPLGFAHTLLPGVTWKLLVLVPGGFSAVLGTGLVQRLGLRLAICLLSAEDPDGFCHIELWVMSSCVLSSHQVETLGTSTPWHCGSQFWTLPTHIFWEFHGSWRSDYPGNVRILSSVRVRVNIRTKARVGLTFCQLSVGDPGSFCQLGFWIM